MGTTPLANQRTDAEATAPLLLTKPEAARALRLSVRTIENAMREKRLAFVKIGSRSVRFSRADIDGFIASHRIRSVAG